MAKKEKAVFPFFTLLQKIAYGVFVIVLFGIIFTLITLILTHKDNTDPRRGAVYVGAGVTKQCDGTTLIYDGEGTQLVMNSPECQ
jgi:hypothetical protein